VAAQVVTFTSQTHTCLRERQRSQSAQVALHFHRERGTVPALAVFHHASEVIFHLAAAVVEVLCEIRQVPRQVWTAYLAHLAAAVQQVPMAARVFLVLEILAAPERLTARAAAAVQMRQERTAQPTTAARVVLVLRTALPGQVLHAQAAAAVAATAQAARVARAAAVLAVAVERPQAERQTRAAVVAE
jgi:hypothetical protein